MTHPQLARRNFLQAVAAAGATGCLAVNGYAEEPAAPGGLREPVFRVSAAKNDGVNGAVANAAPHPLDPALKMAQDALSLIQATIKDYTCTIVKRELPVDDPQVRCPDIGRARALLGWKPEVEIDRGLEMTIQYFRKILAS